MYTLVESPAVNTDEVASDASEVNAFFNALEVTPVKILELNVEREVGQGVATHSFFTRVASHRTLEVFRSGPVTFPNVLDFLAGLNNRDEAAPPFRSFIFGLPSRFRPSQAQAEQLFF